MARTVLTLEKAREIRKWWTANVHRLHNGEIRVRALRSEVGLIYGVGERCILDVLSHKSHREPPA